MSKSHCAVCGICFFSIVFTLPWWVFQARETVPGVTSRPLGPFIRTGSVSAPLWC
jgi:hypothetical protein